MLLFQMITLGHCIKSQQDQIDPADSLQWGVSIHWTGLLDSPKIAFPAIFSVGQKLNTLIDSPKLLA